MVNYELSIFLISLNRGTESIQTHYYFFNGVSQLTGFPLPRE